MYLNSRVSDLSTVGSSMFVMVYTKLDIVQTVKADSIASLRRDHWTVKKWILYYLRDTIKVTSCYDVDVDNTRDRDKVSRLLIMLLVIL